MGKNLGEWREGVKCMTGVKEGRYGCNYFLLNLKQPVLLPSVSECNDQRQPHTHTCLQRPPCLIICLNGSMFCTLSASGWHDFEQTLYIAHTHYICYSNIMSHCISTMQVGTANAEEHAALYSSHLQSFVCSRCYGFVS